MPFSIADAVRRHVLLPATDRWRFWGDVDARIATLEERDRWEPERLRRWQLEQLRHVLEYCNARVPFYRRRFAAAGFDPSRFDDVRQLESVPPLTKKDIREHGEDLFATGVARWTVKAGRTGGSTGVPTPFHQSHEEQAWVEAETRRCRRWEGFLPTSRAVALGGRNYRPTWKTRLVRAYVRHVRRLVPLPSPFLTDEKLDEYIAAIDDWRPEVVYGYPSAVYLLSRRMTDRGHRFPFVRVVETGSEKLFDHQRAAMREAFGFEPYDGYGGGDSPVAWECPAHRGLHVLQTSRYIEFVDDAGRAVAPGEKGRVLVTTFHNDAWPYVRYDMDDLAEPMPDEACTCGCRLPRIRCVHGRAGDILRTPDGRSITPANVTLVFGPLHDRVLAYQLVQETPERIVALVVPGPLFADADERRLVSDLRSFMGDVVGLEVRRVADIEKTPAGKHLILVSRVRPVA